MVPGVVVAEPVLLAEVVALPEPLRVVVVWAVEVPLPGRAVLWPEETAEVTGGTTPLAPEVVEALPVVAGEEAALEPEEAPVEEADAPLEEMPETPPPQSELAAVRALSRSSLEQPFSRQGVACDLIFSWFSGVQAHLRSVREQPVLVRAGSRQVICVACLSVEVVQGERGKVARTAHWGTWEMSGSWAATRPAAARTIAAFILIR